MAPGAVRQRLALTVQDASKTQIQLTFSNTYIRFLGAYIQVFDASGAAMNVPDWQPDGEQELIAGLDIQYPTIRYLGHIGPQNNVMAIPLPPAKARKRPRSSSAMRAKRSRLPSPASARRGSRHCSPARGALPVPWCH